MRNAKLRRCRTGFTLIELLVTIAVISVLVALLLPAVQRAREAARLSSCKNNLKQLGLALHNFHEESGKIPASELATNWATWSVFLMPYLELGPSYDSWDLTKQYYAQVPEAGFQSTVMLCPSRSGVENRGGEGDADLFIGGPLGFSVMTGPAGWSDYACVGGTAPGADDGAFIVSLNHNGQEPTTANPNVSDITATYENWKFQRSFKDITDGLSNTLFFGEKHFAPGADDNSVLNGDFTPSYLRYCGNNHPIVKQLFHNGSSWFRLFGSSHQGSCNFTFGDGHVRSISVNIDETIQQKLTTISDGEIIGEF